VLFILPKGGENVSEKDLRPVRTKEEAKERGRNGGIASGKARREKKTIREAFALLKDLPLDNEKLREKLKKAGVTNDDMTYGAAMAYMTVINGMKGNPSFMRLAFEMLGENDVQGVSKIPGTMNVHFSNNPEDFK
jgi:hypothetical protein